MKKLTVILIGLFLMTFAFQSVNAQTVTDNATGNSDATILSTITITADQDLRFGAIGNVGSGGTVEIPTTTGAAAILTTVTHPVAANVGQQGTFNVSGAESATYVITLPASATLTNTGTTGGSMTISDFKCDPLNNPGTESLIGTLSTAGIETLSIGGTLTVNAGQNNGLYTGTYVVTVAYN